MMIEIQLQQQRYHHRYFLNEEKFIFLRMGGNKIFVGALTIKVMVNYYDNLSFFQTRMIKLSQKDEIKIAMTKNSRYQK